MEAAKEMNIIGGKHEINKQFWALSLVRNNYEQHAYLILEGIDEKNHRIIRKAHLVRKEKKPEKADIIYGDLSQYKFFFETSIPKDLTKYTNEYIVCARKTLFYVHSNKTLEPIKIDDFDKLLMNFDALNTRKEAKIGLFHSEFTQLITENGGHSNPIWGGMYRLQEIGKNCSSYSWRINMTQVRNFDRLIAEQQKLAREDAINYVQMGHTQTNASLCPRNENTKVSVDSCKNNMSIDALYREGHNCGSWADFVINALNLHRNGKELSFFAAIPLFDISGNHDADEPDTTCSLF